MTRKATRSAPLPSGVRLLILQQLIQHGELTAADAARKAGLVRGSVYTSLKRLEREHLVSSRQKRVAEPPSGGPLRRLYKLTTRGRRTVKLATHYSKISGSH